MGPLLFTASILVAVALAKSSSRRLCRLRPPPQPPKEEKKSREALKAERYKRLLPRLKMQKRMYDNITMRSPSGTILCTISSKKAKWYLSRSLAKHSPQGDGITLTFVPKDKVRACFAHSEGATSTPGLQ